MRAATNHPPNAIVLGPQTADDARQAMLLEARLEAMIALAGPVAGDHLLGVNGSPEALLADRLGKNGETCDEARAEHAIHCVVAIEGRRGKRRFETAAAEMVAEVRRIVAENWQSIERFAAELRKHRHLDYDHIMAIWHGDGMSTRLQHEREGRDGEA
jgi:hypothetical protein